MLTLMSGKVEKTPDQIHALDHILWFIMESCLVYKYNLKCLSLLHENATMKKGVWKKVFEKKGSNFCFECV